MDKQIPYRLGHRDVVSVKSPTMREFRPTRAYPGYPARVDRNGMLNLPLVGKVYSKDQTLPELDEKLQTAIRKYYSKGDIAAEVSEFGSKHYIVMGEVYLPGKKSWKGNQTLLEVVADSFPTSAAWLQKILIIRRVDSARKIGYIEKAPAVTNAKILNKNYIQIEINLDEMVVWGDMKNNVLILPGDVVFLQLTPGAYLGRALQKAFDPERAKPAYKKLADSK